MKVGGQILWNVIPICETSQIYYLMGKLHTRDVLGNHLKDRLFHLVHWLSIGLFLEYALYAGGIWKGDVLVADLEELKTMDASEIYSRKR